MSLHFTCDGCQRSLEIINGWHINAVRTSTDLHDDGLEIETDLCDACVLKMKFAKRNK